MDRATLVTFDIEIGNEIVAALEEAGLKPNVALWAVLEEYGDARFVLASRKLDQKSPFKANGEVLAALRDKQIDSFRVPPLLVFPMVDEFIQSLRHTFGKTSSVHGMRLGGQSFGGRYLEEGFVYRID